MNYTFFIGIDVSKNTLDFSVMCGKQFLFHSKTANDLAGLKEFWSVLKSQAGFELSKAIFCMEHTGIYNQHLLNFLHTKKANICLEASVHIKLSSGLQRGKNDKIDAQRIAWYAFRNQEELKLWQPKRQVVQRLKYLAALRSRLLNAKKQLSVAWNETRSFDKQAASEMKKISSSSINALEKDVKLVEDKMSEIINSDRQLKELFAVITSVQGIGKVTATAMIITTNEFRDITEPAKFACYAGVAPFEHASGTSLRGKPRVSHKANKTMKSLLHMSALVAICYNNDLKAYYQRKVDEKKNKMSIINAVRNKLIWRIFACVRNNKIYEKNYQPAIV